VKKILRSRGVQRFAAALLAGYLKLCYATMRWTFEGIEMIEAAKLRPEGLMVCFWHARISLSGHAWQNSRTPKTIYGLVSRSNDGDFITDTMERLGFPNKRGSRAHGADADKGGAQAFRDMVRSIKAGNGQAMTPDGPRGPAEVMGEGAPTLARVTGVPVYFLGMASKPCVRINSWDRTVVPLPFSRGAIVWGGPVSAGRDDDLATLAADWSGRLNAATERAEALVT
jgi:lysophospholipid acyltransferase (LPLAT)-like uncharacterized protein